MKLIVNRPGLPNIQLDVSSSTTIAEAKNMLSVKECLNPDRFYLSVMQNELNDSITIGDVAVGGSDETAVDLVMEKRGVFVKNIGDGKYLIYGTKTSFQVISIDQDEGSAIKTNVFGIATASEEKDGKKTYQAKIYKANPNHRNKNYRQIKIEGSGKQIKVIKVKTDGAEKELIPLNTLTFDEGQNNPTTGGPDAKEFALPVFMFLTMAGDLIKTVLEMA